MRARNRQRTIFLSLAAGLVLAAVAEDQKPPPAKGAGGPGPRVAIEPRAPKPAPGSEPAGSGPKSREATIITEKTIVQINVSVFTPLGQVVTGMEQEHFKLFEDKVQQKIETFTSEEAPLSVGLVFDISGSMGSKLAKSRQAAKEFFKSANPEDEFFLVQFNERPQLAVEWTRSSEEIINRLAFTQARGRTALLDGLYLAMNEMKKARNPRKAILVLSDGGDNSSRYTETEIKNIVREADVQMYAMGIFESVGGRGRSPEELAGPGLLTELSEQTGGRHFPVDDISNLPDVAAKIGVELRSQYMIGYSPTNGNKDGKYRRVEVKLAQPRGLPPLKAYFRTGYYAPTQ
ncbi:MAG: VWA domain-containing protein [Bryobacterales bacterium]|nr:VWA domain-containing protein [Bryobacterales bacterium]